MPFVVLIVLLLAAAPAGAQASALPHGDGGDESAADVLPARAPAATPAQPTGVWQAYKPQVIALITLQTGLIVTLLLQRTRRLKVETALRHAEEAGRESRAILEASHRENHDLAGRLITSQEGERARIARDLHDDLSQQLAGLSIALSAFKRRLIATHRGGDLPAEFASLQQRTLGIADNIRRLSHDLHPSVLQHAGLVTALRDHCADVGRWHAIDVSFSVDGDFAATDPAAALCLYRVAQEALRNVAAHAAAGRVEVRLWRTADEAQLTIADNGRGFDIQAAGRRASGLGLVSISERVRLAGGSVSIVTELNKGTRVRVQIPATGHLLASPTA